MDDSEKTCSLCGEKFTGFGNNPAPFYDYEKRCCNTCNNYFVIPARIGKMNDMTLAFVKTIAKRYSISELKFIRGLIDLGSTFEEGSKRAMEAMAKRKEEEQ